MFLQIGEHDIVADYITISDVKQKDSSLFVSLMFCVFGTLIISSRLKAANMN